MPPPAGSISLRSDDLAAVHAWSREIHFLLPSLLASEVKASWLKVRTEENGRLGKARRQRVVLDSAGRLGFFDKSKKLGSLATRGAELLLPPQPKHSFSVLPHGQSALLARA